MTTHIKALQAQTDKMLRGMRIKAVDDRDMALAGLKAGDPSAIAGLHDWHQDNPDHPEHGHQEEHVRRLHHWIGSAANDDEAEERAKSAHAHLINKPFEEGDAVVPHYADSRFRDGHTITKVHKDGTYDTNKFTGYQAHHLMHTASFHLAPPKHVTENHELHHVFQDAMEQHENIFP